MTWWLDLLNTKYAFEALRNRLKRSHLFNSGRRRSLGDSGTIACGEKKEEAKKKSHTTGDGGIDKTCLVRT